MIKRFILQLTCGLRPTAHGVPWQITHSPRFYDIKSAQMDDVKGLQLPSTLGGGVRRATA